MSTLRGLFEALPVCTLEGDSFEQDHHHQVETPYLEPQILSQPRQNFSQCCKIQRRFKTLAYIFLSLKQPFVNEQNKSNNNNNNKPLEFHSSFLPSTITIGLSCI
jgi:hypothetical protein